MIIRTAKTLWEGGIENGEGRISGSGTDWSDNTCSYSTRFGTGNGVSPEELIAAAHSACFSMMLAAELEKAGYYPQQILTEDEVQLDNIKGKYVINRIDVCTEAMVPGIPFSEFFVIADRVKEKCPLSVALENVEIVLHATLKMGIVQEIIL